MAESVEQRVSDAALQAIQWYKGNHPWSDEAPWEMHPEDYDGRDEIMEYIVGGHIFVQNPNDCWTVVQELSDSREPVSDRVANYLSNVVEHRDVDAETLVSVIAREMLIDATLERIEEHFDEQEAKADA